MGLDGAGEATPRADSVAVVIAMGLLGCCDTFMPAAVSVFVAMRIGGAAPETAAAWVRLGTNDPVVIDRIMPSNVANERFGFIVLFLLFERNRPALPLMEF